MKTRLAILGLLASAAIALLILSGNSPVRAQGAAEQSHYAPLQLIQRIPAPAVSGRIDHFTAYPKRRLLIFAALGNNSVEIVNTFEDKVIQSIKGLERTSRRTIRSRIQQAFRRQRSRRHGQRL